MSKHFAIKSDLPEHKVKHYLELLELSYPHYVSLFGAEPASIENQRIAVVYGASRESTKSTMLDDGFTRGVHKHAGGETMYYNRAGYSFPSHREQHQRYIVIHETMHAFHMALTGHSTWAPNWITEGLADSIASHVYYPEDKALAVMVFDRAPMNYIQSGLKQYAKGAQPSIEQINNDPSLKRGLNFFVIHFLLSDPERAFYFSLFRDRLMAANPHSDDTLPTASRLLKETFPDWPALELAFADYVKAIKPSFMIANGPWEQNGNQYWIRTYQNPTPARLDIRSKLNQGVKFDFPQPESSELISTTPNLIAATKIDFTPEHLSRGSVGLGLGVDYSDNNRNYFEQYQTKYQSAEDSYLSILVHQGRKVTISGVNHDFETQSFALLPELAETLKQELSMGLSSELSKDKLTLTLATQKHKQQIDLELNDELTQSINKGNFALLANNNSHKLTPYFANQPNADSYYTMPDHKQWTSNSKLYRMFKTCVEFNLACPGELMTKVDELATEHTQDIAQLHEQIMALASDQPEALLSLSGLAFHLVHDRNGLRQEVDVPANTSADLNNEFTWWQGDKKLESFAQLKRVSTGSQQHAIRTNNKAEYLTVNTDVEWLGNKFTVTQSTKKQAFDGVYLAPKVEFQKDQLSISATLTGPYSGATDGTITFELLPSKNSATTASQKVKLSPYESKTWQHSFALPQSPKAGQAIEVTADLVVDGEGVLLTELIYLTK